jgi:hypothetical protein
MERVMSQGMVVSRIKVTGALAFALTLAASAAQSFDCPAGDPAYGVSNLGGFYYNALDNNFIAIESRTAHPSGDWLMLEHCPTRQRLSVLGDPDLPAEATNIFWRMVNSDETNTFQQMSDLIVRGGASVAIGQGQVDSCACQLQANPATRKEPR